MYRFVIGSQAEKGRDLTKSFDKRPLPSENKSQEAAQRRQQKLRFHNNCGPVLDGQLE